MITTAPLSPIARLVMFLDSIPDDPAHPDYAKWQTVDKHTTVKPVTRKPTTVKAVSVNAA